MFLQLIISLSLINGMECMERPWVQVKSGEVEGSILNTFNNRKLFAFRGIPYGKPPIGAKRFKNPEAVEPWKGVLDATEEGPICPQLGADNTSVVGQEDCLFLSVYTPKIPTDDVPVKFPVMVFIHGGGFRMGSGTSTFSGPYILLDKDVILVTINYRLSALGFLSTEDKISPGNYGLWDQRLALQWVQENIHAFGGNPDLVTIFGSSAGGASVIYHILSSASKGLFHRAIVQSGSALCPWAFQEEPLKIARRLAKDMNCPFRSDDLLRCLRQKDAVEIIKIANSYSRNIYPFAFAPSEEPFDVPHFLEQSPVELLRNGHLNHVPVIVGVTANEGVLYALDEIEKIKLLQGEESKKYIEKSLVEFGEIEMKDVPKLLQLYMKGINLTDVTNPHFVSDYVEAVSDASFGAGIQETALQLAKNSIPVYMYRTEYHIKNFYRSTVFGENITGVSHSEDLNFLITRNSKLFGNELPEKLEGDDKIMSDKVTAMWINFATYGNPTPKDGNDVGITWTQTIPGKIDYLRLRPNLQMAYSSPSEKLKFWSDTANKFATKKRLCNEL